MCCVAIIYKSALGFRGQNSLSLSVKFPCLFFTGWFFLSFKPQPPMFIDKHPMSIYMQFIKIIWEAHRYIYISVCFSDYFTSWCLLWSFCPNLYPWVRAEILRITVVIICWVRPSLIDAIMGIDALMVSFCGEYIYMHVYRYDVWGGAPHRQIGYVVACI